MTQLELALRKAKLEENGTIPVHTNVVYGFEYIDRRYTAG